MPYNIFLIAIVVSYFLGSIPFGVILTKARGINLRSIGSGNIGATNVSRALGRKWGYICFTLDVLKGLIPMLATLSLARAMPEQSQSERVILLWLWLATGCSAIVGHIFPIYLRFKGGKGVATSFGVALGLWPYFTICAVLALMTWVVAVLTWRYISLASIIASTVFPLVLIIATILIPAWNFNELWPILSIAIAIPVMVVVRHRENMKRLIEGTETKIRQNKRPN